MIVLIDDKQAREKAESIAKLFHETYERLAPSFGYLTAEATRTWKPDSPNARLMTAVCGEVLESLSAQVAELQKERGRDKVTHDLDLQGKMLEAAAAQLAEAFQYRTGHLPSCAGMDSANQRCGCGYLDGTAYRELLERAEAAEAQVAELKKDAEPMYQPKPDRRIGAFTPTIYPGHLESRPPPFINIYESHNASPSVIVTVRGVANKDGSQGPVSCMEILEPEFREFITYCARWLGWLPITEEQWLRYYEINKPDAAKESGP